MDSDPALFAPPAPSTACHDSDDPELDVVYSWFSRSASARTFGDVLRQSIDEVLDGQRTGRFDLDTLDKTEKTYLGIKVDNVCRAAFGLARGTVLNYSVDGVEIDTKFSLQFGAWMIPQETMGHPCLLLTADDHAGTFSAGLVRIRDEILTRGGNQDRKRSISRTGRSTIQWLVHDGELPINTLLHLPTETRQRILANPHSGQQRVNQLFREVQQRMLNRETVVTVGRQADALKRVRDARGHLHDEGILILGHQKEDRRIAHDLGLPLSGKGSWLAVRVVPAPLGDKRPTTRLCGTDYVIARSDEPAQPGPNSYRYRDQGRA